MRTDTKFSQSFSHNFTSQAGRVRRTGLVLTLCLLGFLLPVRAQDQDPWITYPDHPMDTNVSLGASVSFYVSAGTAYWPLTIQWQHNGTNLPGARGYMLTLTNVTARHGGSYTAWVTNAINGFTNTRTASVTVDPTFVKITSGAVVTDQEPSFMGSWCDYDGDGFLDLFVANGGDFCSAYNSLYHNNGNGTFTKITTTELSATLEWWNCGTWADIDNDGDPDIYVQGNTWGHPSMFYRNDGNARFTAVPIVPTMDPVGRDSASVAWGDYDQDGWVDLFIPAFTHPGNHRLFRNLGDLNFKSMTTGEVGDLVSSEAHESSPMATWIDYDNDGDLDIYLWQTPHFALYLNSPSGFFTRTFEGSIANAIDRAGIPSWADYDNDGYLDLFEPRPYPFGVNALHHNLSGTDSVEVTQAGLDLPMNTIAGSWGDYDNDGNIDLFVVNAPNWLQGWPLLRAANVLYRNNGDGTFTDVDVGSPIWEGYDDWNSCWVDYDNDGFLDLFIAAGQMVPEVNYLYRNNLPVIGRTNHWLKVSLVGKASNASGIGAKVRATASIRGQTVTQLRVIESPPIGGGNQGLLAHFGLGDATNVTMLQIEWPSGIVQKLPNVAADQFLTNVVESQSYTNTNAIPKFTGAAKVPGGLQLSFTEPASNALYTIEASTNLVDWTKLVVRTSVGVDANYTDTRATSYTRRYYRLLVP